MGRVFIPHLSSSKPIISTVQSNSEEWAIREWFWYSAPPKRQYISCGQYMLINISFSTKHQTGVVLLSRQNVVGNRNCRIMVTFTCQLWVGWGRFYMESMRGSAHSHDLKASPEAHFEDVTHNMPHVTCVWGSMWFSTYLDSWFFNMEMQQHACDAPLLFLNCDHNWLWLDPCFCKGKCTEWKTFRRTLSYDYRLKLSSLLNS